MSSGEKHLNRRLKGVQRLKSNNDVKERVRSLNQSIIKSNCI